MGGDGDDRHDDQDEHLDAEEQAGDLSGEGDTANHHHDRHRGEHQRPDDPGDVDAQVVLQGDLHEAIGDGDDRCHGDDVAEAGQQGRRDGARRAEGLPDERDEATRRRLGPRELRQGVAQQRDGDTGRDDGQGRGDSGREGQEAEAEEERHRRPDVGHRRRCDVHHPQRAASQPVGLAGRTRRTLGLDDLGMGRGLCHEVSWVALGRSEATTSSRSVEARK